MLFNCKIRDVRAFLYAVDFLGVQTVVCRYVILAGCYPTLWFSWKQYRLSSGLAFEIYCTTMLSTKSVSYCSWSVVMFMLCLIQALFLVLLHKLPVGYQLTNRKIFFNCILLLINGKYGRNSNKHHDLDILL